MSNVKVAVLERDGIDLEYEEEIAINEDVLSSRGIQFFNTDFSPGPGLYGGSLNPSIDGFTALIGSHYFKDDNTTWKKFGSADTDWQQVTQSTTAGSFPQWFIPPGVVINVGDFQQYIIHFRNYLIIAGTLNLGYGTDVGFD